MGIAGWWLLVPVGVSLLLAYWPSIGPRLWRVRRTDDPIPALVILRPNGREWFLTRLPRKKNTLEADRVDVG